jgi:protein-S-isoprenylcysteine O-methyltransferase Ste14
MTQQTPSFRGKPIEVWSRIARRIRVPMGFLFAAIFLWRLYYVPPTWRSLALSLLLVIPGLLIRAAASGYVKKNTELATTGPYAYTRNPLYLGSTLMAFGFAVASRSWLIFILLAVLFVIIYVPTILSEEAWLRNAFPGFDAYTQRVPRLIPRLIPGRTTADSQSATPVTGGSFSMSLYLQHREYNSALGAIAIYAALLARLYFGQRLL